MKFDSGYERIPEFLQKSIEDWVEYGITPGHFLQAVISNDLFNAVSYADEGSMSALKLIVQFFYNRLPIGCWGPNALTTWPKHLAK